MFLLPDDSNKGTDVMKQLRFLSFWLLFVLWYGSNESVEFRIEIIVEICRVTSVLF